MNLIKALVSRLPDLRIKLRVARLPETPEYYLKRTLTIGGLIAFSLTLVIFGFTKSPLVILAFPFLFVLTSAYVYRYVDLVIAKAGRLANQELVYATRYLVIQLESGLPLYATFENIAKNYEHVGIYFREINDKLNLGTPLTDAINQTIETSPSDELRKILWQILNSMQVGSEVTAALQSVLEQVVREQKIAVVEYGRKLNPLAMLYMMIAIIVPSLGTTMLIVMATFIGFPLSLTILMVLAGLLLFVQFMFLAVIRSQRPAVEL